MQKKSILIVYFLILFSCQIVEKTTWKYRNGFYIGDGITFGETILIENDTIYINQIANAIIVKQKQRWTDKLLIIQDIESDSIGYYCSK